MTAALPLPEAVRRVRADHDLLLASVDGKSDEDLTKEYATTAGPLGDFCESLHDLVAHVLMWSEINLAVLTEAELGRRHWSLAPRWETPAAGQALNRAGVAAGRMLAGAHLVDRLETTRDALLAQLARYDDDTWTRTVGPMATRAFTVPERPPFWHAAIHLGDAL